MKTLSERKADLVLWFDQAKAYADAIDLTQDILENDALKVKNMKSKFNLIRSVRPARSRVLPPATIGQHKS